MAMKRNIQAVLFDAGYTLLCMDPDQPTIFLRVCEQLGIELDQARLPDGVKRANAMLAPRHPREVPVPFSQAAVDQFWTDYNRILLSVCARRPSDADKAERVYRLFTSSIAWRVYDEVHGVLAELRSRRLCLGIVSNWSGDLEDVLAKVGLRDQFDFVLDSAHLGHEKPHAPIFKEAVRRAGASPDAIMHVGDSPEHDIDGALALGLHAVLLDRSGRYREFDRAPRIESLEGLMPLLG